MHTKSWTVEIYIGEHDGSTRAEARLVTEPSAVQLTGWGIAKLNPADPDIPEIGDELATARALGDLAHQLLETAAVDIGATTREPVSLSH